MNDKNTFLLFAKHKECLDFLTYEQKGKLLDAIFDYANDLPISFDDSAVKMAFSFIKLGIDENNNKWQEIKKKRIESGRKGGLAKLSKAKQNKANPSKTKQCLPLLSNAKECLANVAVSDNDPVSVNININTSTTNNPREETTLAPPKKEKTVWELATEVKGFEKISYIDARNALPEDWDHIMETESFKALSANITKGNLISWQSRHILTASQVQKSLDDFVFDGDMSIKVLFGSLNAGQMYCSHKCEEAKMGKITPKFSHSSAEKPLANVYDVMEKKRQNQLKQREEDHKAYENSPETKAFETWFENLTQEEIDAIVPENDYSHLAIYRKAACREYYLNSMENTAQQ